MNTGASVSFIELFVNLDDLFQQLYSSSLTDTWPAFQPLVVT